MRKFLFLPFILSIAAVSLLTGCSDSSSDNNNSVVVTPTEPNTPIDKENTDSFTGNYKGLSLSYDNYSTADGRQILDFEAYVVITKKDDDTLTAKYNFQYSGYNISNTNPTGTVEIAKSDIGEINDNAFDINITVQSTDYKLKIQKAGDYTNQKTGSLWSAKDLCNMDIKKCDSASTEGCKSEGNNNFMDSRPNSCYNAEYAMRFAGAYRLKEIIINGCNNNNVILSNGGSEFIGEIVAHPNLDPNVGVKIPIELKLQFNQDNVSQCWADSSDLFYFKELYYNVPATGSVLYDLVSVFQNVGLISIPGNTKEINYLPKEEGPYDPDSTRADFLINGKKVTMKFELIRSGDMSGNAVKTISNTPYWK